MSSDWQVSITKYLIEGGTQGRRQSAIIVRANGKVDESDVIAFLMSLAAERKVQKFILPNGVIQWRATSNIEKKN
jgi:hypothetical protein